ncbi:LOW QUALITY PROTEIN: lysosome-associated membrane glycoprotein 5 [Vipera latastei]
MRLNSFPPPVHTAPGKQPLSESSYSLSLFFFSPTDALTGGLAEPEVENLSGLSPNPEKAIFVVRENGTTCLMAEFAAKLVVPYEIWASNFVDMITEQAYIPLSRGAEERGKCKHESELHISWLSRAYTLSLYFQETRNTNSGPEAWWKMSKVQFVYDSNESTYFKGAVNQHKCPVDQREQLEETLPLILGLILGLVIVVTLGVYHIHLKMTANQVQIPPDRSEYKHMG